MSESDYVTVSAYTLFSTNFFGQTDMLMAKDCFIFFITGECSTGCTTSTLKLRTKGPTCLIWRKAPWSSSRSGTTCPRRCVLLHPPDPNDPLARGDTVCTGASIRPKTTFVAIMVIGDGWRNYYHVRHLISHFPLVTFPFTIKHHFVY